jgi:hypothetical protein
MSSGRGLVWPSLTLRRLRRQRLQRRESDRPKEVRRLQPKARLHEAKRFTKLEHFDTILSFVLIITGVSPLAATLTQIASPAIGFFPTIFVSLSSVVIVRSHSHSRV